MVRRGSEPVSELGRKAYTNLALLVEINLRRCGLIIGRLILRLVAAVCSSVAGRGSRAASVLAFAAPAQRLSLPVVVIPRER